MTHKGWHRDSARHSLASRGMKTKRTRPQPQHAVVPTAKSLSKEPTQDVGDAVDLERIAGALEDDAFSETNGTEGEVVKLLGDEAWLKAKLKEYAVPDELHEAIMKKVVNANTE